MARLTGDAMSDAFFDQYRDPRWQKKRLDVFERDVFACTECGARDKPLHAHHRRYIRGAPVWAYKAFMLLTLCEDCHEAVHAGDMWLDEWLGIVLRQLAPNLDGLRNLQDLFHLIGGDVDLPVQMSQMEWESMLHALEDVFEEILAERVKRVAKLSAGA